MKRDNKKDREGFWEVFLELRDNPAVQQLKQYPNHRISNLYDHSSRVAVCAYDLANRFHWNINGSSLAKGAMLHDFYLYQARGHKSIGTREHWLKHPATALKNAEKEFALSDKERNIILSHMWPLTIWHVPKSREAILVGAADKICAFGEMFLKRNHIRREKRLTDSSLR